MPERSPPEAAVKRDDEAVFPGGRAEHVGIGGSAEPLVQDGIDVVAQGRRCPSASSGRFSSSVSLTEAWFERVEFLTGKQCAVGNCGPNGIGGQ